MWCGCSKEPSHRDGSFEYPQHMFWLRNKNNNYLLRTLIWGAASHLSKIQIKHEGPESLTWILSPILLPRFKSFDFCHLLITFVNSLEPGSDWQNVGPDLDPNCLTLILKDFSEKDDFEKISRQQNGWFFFIQHAKSERVKSIYSKVNLRLIVGDWTCVILFGGLCHMLSHHCIGQLHTCLLDWILFVPVNNFSEMSKRVFLGWASTKQGLMCLAKGHNAVKPVRLVTTAPRSRVKYFNTEPLRSLSYTLSGDLWVTFWEWLGEFNWQDY